LFSERFDEKLGILIPILKFLQTLAAVSELAKEIPRSLEVLHDRRLARKHPH
jgi:hypothetical protein